MCKIFVISSMEIGGLESRDSFDGKAALLYQPVGVTDFRSVKGRDKPNHATHFLKALTCGSFSRNGYVAETQAVDEFVMVRTASGSKQ
jgi:hypothetical protein